jgi:hypothetical protein
MDAEGILSRLRFPHRPGRPFDPDRDWLVHRAAEARRTLREHAASHGERLEQGKAFLADAIRRGARYESCAPHHALFAKSMELAKGRYARAVAAWASGATDHLPVPIADPEPCFDLCDSLWTEVEGAA